jgi:trypsin
VGRKKSFVTLKSDNSHSFEGSTMIISGWGTISFNGTQSPDLKISTVVGLSNRECSNVYGGITSNMICAGTANFDTDTCQGDSGGDIIK